MTRLPAFAGALIAFLVACAASESTVPTTSSGAGGNGGSAGAGGAGGTLGLGGAPVSLAGGGGSVPQGGEGGTSVEVARPWDLCADDAACAPLVCRAMTVGGAQRCTPSCTQDTQCMTGTRCIGGACLASDVGRSCAGSADCNFACLSPPGHCTMPCVNGYDCANGYGCMAVGSPAQRVCVRVESFCTAGVGAECVAQAACVTGDTVIDACTIACESSADCPQRAGFLTPWTCATSGPLAGLCDRPADVYGPLPGGYQPTEWFCSESTGNTYNLCGDGQHINFDTFSIPPPPSGLDCGSETTTAGAAGDACLNTCRYQGGCPYDYACVGLSEKNGQRYGLCLPTGPTDVGGFCQKDGDCAFGYCLLDKHECSKDCSKDGLCPTGSTCTPGNPPSVEGVPFKRCEKDADVPD